MHAMNTLEVHLCPMFVKAKAINNQLIQEGELKAHENLVRCMLWLASYNQVWSADVSGNIVIWDATVTASFVLLPV